MKKLLLLLGMALVLVLAACGNSDEKSSDDTNASSSEEVEDNAVDTKALSTALLKNHIELANTIRTQYADVSAYVDGTANTELEAEALETLKTDATTAIDEAVAALDSFELVNSDDFTEDAKTTYEEAIADVKGAFEAYKEAIENGTNDFTAADEKLAAYSEKVTPLFEEAGLTSTPDLAVELQ